MKITKLVGVFFGLAIFIGSILIGANYAQAVTLEKDANPVRMVITDWGGVSLYRQGQERYFKAWDKNTNQLTTVSIGKTNIQSFDADGRNIAYIKSNGATSEIYVYNLDTGISKEISKSYTSKKNIKINGNNLVWEDYAGGNVTTVLHNLSTSTTVVINTENYRKDLTPNSYFEELWSVPVLSRLDVSQDYVVWINELRGIKSIMVYDISTGQKFSIRENVSDKQSLEIYEDKVVWSELRDNFGGGAIYDIYYHDLSTSTTKQLTNSSINQVQPAIWGNFVAWVDTEGGNPNVHLMNLVTGSVSKIACTDYYEVQPSLGYGYIAWIALRGNLADLNVQGLESAGSVVPGQENVPDREIKLLVNGTRYYTTPSPYIKNNRTMVPMRRIFEILGAQVEWNESERSITAVRGSTTIKLFIGSTTAYLNGAPITLEAPPEIDLASSRTMVPLRFVAEATGASVNWDNISRSVIINFGI